MAVFSFANFTPAGAHDLVGRSRRGKARSGADRRTVAVAGAITKGFAGAIASSNAELDTITLGSAPGSFNPDAANQ
jgi:hypothetical protein